MYPRTATLAKTMAKTKTKDYFSAFIFHIFVNCPPELGLEFIPLLGIN